MAGSQVLRGRTVGVTASRGSARLVDGLEAMGAAVEWGPAAELAPAPPARVREETRAVIAAEPEWLVTTTGRGLRRWVEAAGDLEPALLDLLRRTPVAARGRRAARACADTAVLPAVTVGSERGPELAGLVAERLTRGGPVAVQADGAGSPALVDRLAVSGVDVVGVRPYRWVPPADPAPARRLVRRTVDGELDVLVFASAAAVDGIFETAADLGVGSGLRTVLGERVLVAVTGPAVAEAAEARFGYPTLCPTRPGIRPLLSVLASIEWMRREVPGLRLDGARRGVTGAGGTVTLTELEFRLLRSLARRRGLVCPTDVLLREVWGRRVDRRRLEALASRLRGALAPLGLAITNVPKRGYRLGPIGRGSSGIGVRGPRFARW